MTAFCYAAQSLSRSAAVMSGVKPLTSPPIVFKTFEPHLLEGHTMLFFKLHGLPGQPYWYGDGMISAIHADQIRAARLEGALVFAANCFGGPEAPMVKALLAAGARCVVTGEGPNQAGISRVDGADVIGMVWRKFIESGFEVRTALRLGKYAAIAKRPRLKDDIDSFVLVGDGSARLERKS